MSFWANIPEDCRKAIGELKRMKVYRLCCWDCEDSFSDVWWVVLHEVDMYVEGEFCREYGDPDAMNHAQAKRADQWLLRWFDLFEKYKNDSERNWSWDFSYAGQVH